MSDRLKIAIVGSGISGLTAAYLLSRKHDVHLYEANDYLGGHTHTEMVELGGNIYPVNTGFIVFNDWTYPNFIKLMNQLGVAYENSDMSFSVRCENTGLEYNGTSLNSLFAQRRNLLNPFFIKMVCDILRFNKQTTSLLSMESVSDDQTLGEFVKQNGYSRHFVDYYIVPMGAAIWSASEEVMLSFPLRFFLKFFNNHGMLSVDDRPQWHVLSGGSQSYVNPITQSFAGNIKLSTPVKTVSRGLDSVTVTDHSGKTDSFDHVVFACHSDQALQMLSDPSDIESRVLGAIPYQMNDVILHTDTRLMPRKSLAWASWNYHIPQRANNCAMVTYDMNRLQNFDDSDETFLVTLNRNAEIRKEKVIKEFQYAHPVFTQDGMWAQSQHHRISGKDRTSYCGAYWFNGFHEDGVNSALRVAKNFGIEL